MALDRTRQGKATREEKSSQGMGTVEVKPCMARSGLFRVPVLSREVQPGTVQCMILPRAPAYFLGTYLAVPFASTSCSDYQSHFNVAGLCTRRLPRYDAAHHLSFLEVMRVQSQALLFVAWCANQHKSYQHTPYQHTPYQHNILPTQNLTNTTSSR
jgi:hypothetical protein